MKLSYTPAFVDHRGTITDLLVGENVDGIALVTFEPDAVRGNHFHKETTQWTFVTAGTIVYASQESGKDRHEVELAPGDFVVSKPGESHAYRATTSATILVFTKGPRAGFDYEKDTFRLETPLL